ncbi:MAG: sigma-54-dependent Fis family transcriptional regulator [Burkholderiaceae bacterium]|nr:sigma-54-dependent Fis family transcriptional regulator [Burkholderiaceae bacterium]
MPALPLPRVLLVDDEPRSLEAMRRTLEEEFDVRCAGNADEALRLLDLLPADVVLSDQRMPGTTGVALLQRVREQWPETVRIVVSGYSDSADLVRGINEAGIHQYVLKPWMPEHLLQVVRDAADAARQRHGIARLDTELRQGAPALRTRRAALQAQAAAAFGFERIARAPGSPLDALCATAERVARVDLSVLLTGESGTGKELVARAIHYASPRAEGPFVVENCAAIPDTLLESELFGHKRGAFTGAVDDHVGLIARAHGGTLFLDEIGETSPAFQVKLLRVLQEGELRPVGSVRAVPVDVRIVAATHRDLEADVRAGRFREDLYYRLAGMTLQLPPLRERAGDIAPIAERLLALVGAELGRPGLRFADGALAALLGHAWPGNIRELRNEIARAVALADDELIDAGLFSPRVRLGAAARVPQGRATLPATGTLAERLDAVEAGILRDTLERHRWNKTRAAQELALSRVGLRAKLARHGMGEPPMDRTGQEPH